MQRFTILLFLLVVLVEQGQSQFATVGLNNFDRIWYENDLLRTPNTVHSSIMPWRHSDVDSLSRKRELLMRNEPSISGKALKNLITRKLYYEDLIKGTGEDFHLTLNPIAFLSGGLDRANSTNTYQHSRGLLIQGQLGKIVSFYTTFVETQAIFSAHLSQQVATNQVASSYWLTKGFRNGGFDFSYAAGEVAFTPNRIFHIRLGQGKQFLGEGYRSMLISDNTVNYPFFRIETSFWKVKYVNTWAVMNDLRSSVMLGNIFGKKYLSMHYLSINIGSRWNIGLFEGIMWGDELNRYGFDISFLNPIIFYRPVEFAQGFAGGNTLMGMQSSFLLGNGIKLYGQLVLDEFKLSAIRDWKTGDWRNMIGGQLGAKYGDAFNIPNLFIQVEYNAARPYLYSHREIITNWGHYRQPLAHPWGANFEELLVRANYRYKRWAISSAVHWGQTGRDNSQDNWGGDIFKANSTRIISTGVKVGQGEKSLLSYFKTEVSYILNPLYNLRMEAGVHLRNEKISIGGFSNSQHYFLGIRTDMYQPYTDF